MVAAVHSIVWAILLILWSAIRCRTFGNDRVEEARVPLHCWRTVKITYESQLSLKRVLDRLVCMYVPVQCDQWKSLLYMQLRSVQNVCERQTKHSPIAVPMFTSIVQT